VDGDCCAASEGTDPALLWRAGETNEKLNVWKKLLLKRDQVTEALLYIYIVVSMLHVSNSTVQVEHLAKFQAPK
jgi:hypothetical protein